MKRTYAVAMALATLLMAAVASADPPPREEVQAPRGVDTVDILQR